MPIISWAAAHRQQQIAGGVAFGGRQLPPIGQFLDPLVTGPRLVRSEALDGFYDYAGCVVATAEAVFTVHGRFRPPYHVRVTTSWLAHAAVDMMTPTSFRVITNVAGSGTMCWRMIPQLAIPGIPSPLP
jgi:hypothetical protein